MRPRQRPCMEGKGLEEVGHQRQGGPSGQERGQGRGLQRGARKQCSSDAIGARDAIGTPNITALQGAPDAFRSNMIAIDQ